MKLLFRDGREIDTKDIVVCPHCGEYIPTADLVGYDDKHRIRRLSEGRPSYKLERKTDVHNTNRPRE